MIYITGDTHGEVGRFFEGSFIMIIECRKGGKAFSRLINQPNKKPQVAFCIYIIATEIDKFPREICSQILDLRSKFLNFDFRLSLSQSVFARFTKQTLQAAP